ncbi:hypothetical protein ACWNYO_00650 [Candidatus Vidania fulgoroideorum]
MYCVLGNPIRHSLSKNIHKLFLKKNIYFKFRINVLDIYKEIIEFISNDFLFNITLPFKETTIKIYNYIEKKNVSFNVVNKIKNTLFGYNTDKSYFRKIDKYLKNSCIVGLGGIGKTLVYYLLEKKINFSIYSRNNNKIKKFSKLINKNLKLSRTKNIVDCTPCILKNHVPLKFKEKINLISFNYRNISLYIKHYNILRIKDGVNLLIYQAYKTFKIWKNINIKNFKSVEKFLKFNIRCTK